MRVHGVGFAGLVHEGHMQGLAFLAPDERSQDSQVLVRLAALDWLAERVVLVLTEHGLPVHGGTRASLASGGGRKGDLLSNTEKVSSRGRKEDLLSNTERCLAEEGKRTYCLTQKGVWQRKERRLTV